MFCRQVINILYAIMKMELVEYQDSSIINKIETPAPIYELRKWKDDYLIAYLM